MDDQGSQRVLEAGEVIFREGDLGHHAYLIESGAVEIFIERPDGDRVLAQLGPDDLFGEMALVGDQTRTAGARAVVATSLTVITHNLLSDHLDRASPLVRHLLRVTLARCRDALRLVSGVGDGSDASMRTFVMPQGHGADAAGPADRDLAVQRLRMEQALTEAMQRRQLLLYYQPIVKLSGGQIAGFEALVRWQRPDGALVPPGEFIWVIEDSQLILEFGRWTLREAAAGLQRLQAVHEQKQVDDDRLFCSVNLSVRQFGDAKLFPTIRQALIDTGLSSEQLHLEITESAVLNNPDAALELLGRCRALGCHLVVDDFGTGYSSLSYLHRLPIHGLKLDRSFVADAATTERGLRIVRAIGRLAQDLDMYAVAEGIETPEQAAWCQDIGLAFGQGYFFGRPMPLGAAIDALGQAAG
ncbi:MAG: EAL domain-containing protein [Pseudomonadota bacterium]